MSDETISSYRLLDEPSKPIAGLTIRALATAAAILAAGWAAIQIGAPFKAVATIVLVFGGPLFMTAAIATGTVSITREIVAAIKAMVRPGAWQIADTIDGGLYLTDLPDTQPAQQEQNYDWTDLGHAS